MIEKKRVIDYVKTGENTNLIKLSSAYDNNCSSQEYEVIDDMTLDIILTSEREIDSAKRKERNYHIVNLPDDDTKAAKMGAISVSVEEKFFMEYDEEEIQQIMCILSQLTDCQRKRIYMRYKLELSYKQISHIEGVGISTIQASCELALEKLKPYGKFLQETKIVKWVDLLIYNKL